MHFLKERKIFVLTADVENRGYLDTLKEIAEQKKDCGVKVFMDKRHKIRNIIIRESNQF